MDILRWPLPSRPSGCVPAYSRSIACRLARSALLRILSVEVRGSEVMSSPGPKLIVANHVSFIDGILLSVLLPEVTRFAVTDEFVSHRLFGRGLALLRSMGLGDFVSVDPASPFGLRALASELKRGGSAAIFPEGAISVSGNVGDVRPGAAALARLSGATVIPVRLHGLASSVFGRARAQSWAGSVLVEFGSPWAVDREATVESVCSRIHEGIAGARI